MNKSIKDNRNCSGCGVCSVICPQNAISFKVNAKGFMRPIVSDLCIDCGLCKKLCHEHKLSEGHRVQKVYTAYTKNVEIRNCSSSGGVFSEIAMQMIDSGGFVCAATFDKNFELSHQIVDSIEGLEGLRKSKYLESDVTNVWRLIKERIIKKQKGVFVGTPCQCAALRSYLGNCIDNILICDFICHGVASPAIFAKYKNYLSSEYGEPLKIEFRHKENGEGSFFFYQGDKGTYMIPNYTKSYPYAYASGLIIADDCTSCRYCSLDRQSDITLGDYVAGQIDYSKSTIFVNTIKGTDFLRKCTNLVIIDEDLGNVISRTWHLTTPNTYNPNREKVFKKLDYPWSYLEDKFFHKPNKFQLYKQAILKKIHVFKSV